MASKYQKTSNTVGTEDLNVSFVAGASGAIPATFIRANDVYSLTKVSNTYVIKFNRGRTALTNYLCNVLQATYNATTGACRATVTTDDIAGATKSLTVSFYNAAGAAVSPAVGDRCDFTFTVKNSAGLF